MVDEILIENYKSVEKLKIGLGRVNVFIGANGSGKSNILEAIALGGAAVGSRLYSEFLASRGIRLTRTELMRSAFDKENLVKDILISFFWEGRRLSYKISNDNAPFSIFKEEKEGDFIKHDEIMESLNAQGLPQRVDSVKYWEIHTKNNPPYLTQFLIYSPENHRMRNFMEEGQIQPLGIYGEGLFHLLANMNADELAKIKENLKLIEWFQDFHIPDNLAGSERRIGVTDRYISETVEYFDQRSTNEGFLFLLFYITLLISKYTPQFFAIDNIDNSLNPKLCVSLMEKIVSLSREHEKQVILTTHNPSVLDGMDLADPDQRLYVVYRNLDGKTKLKRIDQNVFDVKKSEVRLSEAFIRGYIGGLNHSNFPDVTLS